MIKQSLKMAVFEFLAFILPAHHYHVLNIQEHEGQCMENWEKFSFKLAVSHILEFFSWQITLKVIPKYRVNCKRISGAFYQHSL